MRRAPVIPGTRNRPRNHTRNVDPEGWRPKIAQLLAGGPMYGADIIETLGMTHHVFWHRICWHWFDITGKGWSLNADGRREALGERAK